jgi:hypothetical protein
VRCALPWRLPPCWTRLLKRVFEIDMEHCRQVWRPLDDHHRHRGSPRDGQDPRPSGLVRRSAAPSSGQGLRLNSNWPDPAPIPGSAPEPTLPVVPSLDRDAKTLRNIAPRADEGPDNNARIAGRGLACLTSRRFRRTFPFEGKGPFKNPILVLKSRTLNYSQTRERYCGFKNPHACCPC